MQKHPSLAEIVRQETDGGRRIVQFYLGVADGTLDGFRDHHRVAAARRLDKIAPGLVREYLQKFHNAQIRDSMRGSLFPMGRISAMTKNTPERAEQVPRGPNRFQRRLTRLVRDETGDGRTIFDFLNGVMHGALLGFKPHHRLEAAKELASYITIDNPSSTLTPSPLTGEGWGEGEPPVVGADPRVRPLRGSSVIPADAGTHPIPLPAEPTPTVRVEPVEAARPEPKANATVVPPSATVVPPSTTVVPPSTTVVPPSTTVVPPSTTVVPPSTTVVPSSTPVIPSSTPVIPSSTPVIPSSTPVIPAKAGTHPIPLPAEPTPTVRAEPVEAARPEPKANSTVVPPSTTVVPASTTVIPAEAGTHPVHAKIARPAPQLTTKNQKLETSPSTTVVPAEAGTHPVPTKAARPAPQLTTKNQKLETSPSTTVVPAEAGTHPVPTKAARPAPQLTTKNQKPRTRMPRRLRRQLGDARARLRREAARNLPTYIRRDLERKQQAENPEPVGEHIPNLSERRIKKKLEQHRYGPDPLDGEPAFYNYVPP